MEGLTIERCILPASWCCCPCSSGYDEDESTQAEPQDNTDRYNTQIRNSQQKTPRRMKQKNIMAKGRKKKKRRTERVKIKYDKSSELCIISEPHVQTADIPGTDAKMWDILCVNRDCEVTSSIGDRFREMSHTFEIGRHLKDIFSLDIADMLIKLYATSLEGNHARQQIIYKRTPLTLLTYPILSTSSLSVSGAYIICCPTMYNESDIVKIISTELRKCEMHHLNKPSASESISDGSSRYSTPTNESTI